MTVQSRRPCFKEQAYSVDAATLAALSRRDADEPAPRRGAGHRPCVPDFEDDFKRVVIRTLGRESLVGGRRIPDVCNRLSSSRSPGAAGHLGLDYRHRALRAPERDGATVAGSEEGAGTPRRTRRTSSPCSTRSSFRGAFPAGRLTRAEVRDCGEAGAHNAEKPTVRNLLRAGRRLRSVHRTRPGNQEPARVLSTPAARPGRHRGPHPLYVGHRRGHGLVSEGRSMSSGRTRGQHVTWGARRSSTRIIGRWRASTSFRSKNRRTPSGLPSRRPTAAGAPATLCPPEGGRMTVVFDTPQRAVTPGQGAVFYAGDTVLGGGTIV